MRYFVRGLIARDLAVNALHSSDGSCDDCGLPAVRSQPSIFTSPALTPHKSLTSAAIGRSFPVFFSFVSSLREAK